jgi:acyl carrier protein
VDWASARRELSATSAPTFAGLLPARGARPAAEAAASLEKLRALPLDQAHKILLDVVVKEIAHVLRLPTREIDQNRALTDIGMDSLMMVELRGAVEEQLHIELPVLSLASSITPAEIAQRIVTVIGGGETAVSGSLAALSGSHVGADPARMNATDQKVAAEAVIRHARRLDGPL